MFCISPKLTRLACACAALALAACAPEQLPPSGPHPPLSADQVKIFQAAPAKYEMLGTIEVPVTPEMKWDEKGDSTAGFNALKAKAAAMGANGLLLTADPKLYDIGVGVGYNGTFYNVPLRYQPRTAIASAIFVLKE